MVQKNAIWRNSCSSPIGANASIASQICATKKIFFSRKFRLSSLNSHLFGCISSKILESGFVNDVRDDFVQVGGNCGAGVTDHVLLERPVGKFIETKLNCFSMTYVKSRFAPRLNSRSMNPFLMNNLNLGKLMSENSNPKAQPPKRLPLIATNFVRFGKNWH